MCLPQAAAFGREGHFTREFLSDTETLCKMKAKAASLALPIVSNLSAAETDKQYLGDVCPPRQMAETKGRRKKGRKQTWRNEGG